VRRPLSFPLPPSQDFSISLLLGFPAGAEMPLDGPKLLLTLVETSSSQDLALGPPVVLSQITFPLHQGGMPPALS
jgi:hypothetical protein